MDFSSLNPGTSNSLNIAARNNDVKAVKTLLRKMNPNCNDNRGWTCLHEAAHNDSYDSLVIILKHADCRPLIETHEGHTALYLACRNTCSIKTIQLLLETVKDIANYGSTEHVTPLHLTSAQGRLDVMQLLIDYGAMIDVQDFDGDTPLHCAVLDKQYEAVKLLLHAGADPEIKNSPGLYTAFHLASYRGYFAIVKLLYPFVTDINQLTSSGQSPLMLSLIGNNENTINFLLKKGANANIKDVNGHLAMDIALNNINSQMFKKMLAVTDRSCINLNIVQRACKAHYFEFDILEALLISDLGPEFYNFFERFHVSLECIGGITPCYETSAPLNSFLNICEYVYDKSVDKFKEFFYLFLMRGVAVNAVDRFECPPLVYIHYCLHMRSFPDVLEILAEQGCDVDYCTQLTCTDKNNCIPDAFTASFTADTTTLPPMLLYSLNCDPCSILKFAEHNKVLGRLSEQVKRQLLTMIGLTGNVKAELLSKYVLPLKHLCRYKIRSVIRTTYGGVKSTTEYFNLLDTLPVPRILKEYLRYNT